MAKMTKNSVSMNGGLLMKILIGLLFICIGVQGCAGSESNALYKALNNEAFNVILGIVLIASGLLLIVPIFISGIGNNFIRIAMIIVTVVWVLVIIFSDFVYGFKGVKGIEWFHWLENFIYHVLILSAVLNVTSPSLKK